MIIVNWNTAGFLRSALNLLYSEPVDPPLEIIVVDNASSDGSAEMVAGEFPAAILIANGRNEGYAKACNQGIARANGEYILLLNPDVEVKPSTIVRTAQWLSRNPDNAAVAIRLLSPDGSVQHSVRGFPRPMALFWEVNGFAKIYLKSRFFGAYRQRYFNYSRSSEVEQPMGSFLLIRREALNAIGLLDEEFPIFFNEVDWLYRAHRLGWKIYYLADESAIHYGGAATRLVAPAMAWESRCGLLKFYRKHYRSPLFAPVYWVVVIASWLQAVWVSRKRAHEAVGKAG
ncbi:MAG: glycosyltransferase family 2 protein [Armatimonadetes bacterium]|nr:glycosyltransferase family 2 protein [Armatimonadota bacterium]